MYGGPLISLFRLLAEPSLHVLVLSAAYNVVILCSEEVCCSTYEVMQLHTVASHFRFVCRVLLYLKLRETLNVVESERNRKLLLWLQEHYIYHRFKLNDFLLNLYHIYVFMFFMGHKKLEK
jgi:hypothetical protein